MKYLNGKKMDLKISDQINLNLDGRLHCPKKCKVWTNLGWKSGKNYFIQFYNFVVCQL